MKDSEVFSFSNFGIGTPENLLYPIPGFNWSNPLTERSVNEKSSCYGHIWWGLNPSTLFLCSLIYSRRVLNCRFGIVNSISRCRSKYWTNHYSRQDFGMMKWRKRIIYQMPLGQITKFDDFFPLFTFTPTPNHWFRWHAHFLRGKICSLLLMIWQSIQRVSFIRRKGEKAAEEIKPQFISLGKHHNTSVCVGRTVFSVNLSPIVRGMDLTPMKIYRVSTTSKIVREVIWC